MHQLTSLLPQQQLGRTTTTNHHNFYSTIIFFLIFFFLFFYRELDQRLKRTKKTERTNEYRKKQATPLHHRTSPHGFTGYRKKSKTTTTYMVRRQWSWWWWEERLATFFWERSYREKDKRTITTLLSEFFVSLFICSWKTRMGKGGGWLVASLVCIPILQ